ncbi:MAG: FlgD immunoglobulin-like domain containing protein [Balneolales bacterium]
MKLFAVILFYLSFFAGYAEAQLIGPVPSPYQSISQNSVQNMASFGDTLWIGPSMNYKVGDAQDWVIPEGTDSITDGRGRLFSIALAPDTIFAGLGYNFEDEAGESIQTGMGFYTSVNSGTDWRFIPFPLDDPDVTAITYGGQELEALPVVVAQQSPPFDVDFKDDVMFFAAWASGIRRSMDFGESWERILLPSSNENVLTPEGNYNYIFNPRNDNNFLGFSVLIDSNNQVWAGTADGVNVSPNALSAPADSIIWYHYRSAPRNDALMGNWVVKIKENPADGSIWMTNWITEGGERQGIVRSTDNGETYEQFLIGQRINDIEFDGEYLYAAGDNGLFISRNNGQTWEHKSEIRSPNTFIKPNAAHYSLAKTNDRIWVGTGDGLASTTDHGDNWEISRVYFPLRGGNIHQDDAPDVDSYAYPNPFSPNNHDFVRLKFEVKKSGPVTIRIFDFAMNLIRTVEDELSVSEGTYEAAWDGLDQNGRKVANGPVFYQIKSGSDEYVGKILVLE